ncbi:MAG TPA: TMEM165/GDT1 family protein [Actinocrinis sp.]|nr:TMEM165/GDT1 family protein [Actinocrinis sp.]
MDALVIATTFAVVFLAELPDKTALAGLVLATKYPARLVFFGAAAGFAVQVLIALGAGSLLTLLPHRPLAAVVSALFLLGAVLLLRQANEPAEEPTTEAEDGKTDLKVFLTSFMVITVAEFGDLTQIATANLAAHYRAPLLVGIGSFAALCSVAGLAVLGGQGLLRVVPLKWIVRTAALIMIVLAAISLVQAIRG